MPYYATSQEWLRQSSLLIEARPTTTRITTKYHISKPKPRKPKKSTTSDAPSTTTTTTPATTAPRGSLTLKTYDPHSGTCLKYRTTKAAEVSRLILSLGKPLGNRMAALPLPEGEVDEVMVDAAVAAEEGKKEEAPTPAPTPAATGAGGSGSGSGKQPQQQGGGGGKGKKKKGKK
ncbi:signal recognition particle 9 kDa protein-domain-containing protein [Hypoxylon trugodes]|uniref:signal recognition particle 9 kDa protein-domain-containing protein n=1 Tax=Hypoxylon trugodes TaxID=326681 RepID=UPI00219FBF2D|nr:signal recognition particle 9 kDa protein-domain-containing protein [Hypoxylon trugodes]KAI1393427.1 signal recognition particle 9 kDa protein-domain-containing protein [Hypoxylon trugodes]